MAGHVTDLSILPEFFDGKEYNIGVENVYKD